MTLLLLAGTGEARRIAWSLADSGRPVIASLAGATRDPQPLPVPTRSGGFGGDDGFRAFLDEHEVSAVLDATHPFAARISARTVMICAERGLPYCLYDRPVWTPGPEDDWRSIATPAEAAEIIPENTCVFLATGRQTLAEFHALEGRRVIARVVDPPQSPFPFEGGEFLIGRPPFTEKGDTALFAALGVDWLITKNSGGAGGQGKLVAARKLGIPVLMLPRPPLPEAFTVSSVPEALDWVAAL